MEATDAGGEKKKPPQEGSGEKSTKRKMKTAYQLELLEKTYASESYPSEMLRAELSVKTGLSDRQLQMWFCHRRLKDKKASEMAAAQTAVVTFSGSGSGSSSHHESRKVMARMSGMGVPGMAAAELPIVRGSRYYEPVMVPQPTMSEMKAIAFVESQLGEPIREDGPILGVEFDPLPPGAFGAPIEIQTQVKQIARPYDGKIERHDANPMKTSQFLPSAPVSEHFFIPGASGGRRKPAVTRGHVTHSQAVTRACHEYQFLPEQPSIGSDAYERMTPSHFYDPSVDSGGQRVSPLQPGGPFAHGNEPMTSVYPFHDQAPSAGMKSRQGSQTIFSPGSAEYEALPHKTTYPNSGPDGALHAPLMVGMETSISASDRRIFHEEDSCRLEKKRKSEEARIAKEVEAHEKRIRKELEKQDILRRKREEQMRKEMERHDRERRKEEERLLREKQREEERFQRELRREHERRERFLQKESLRAEKMRVKEEMRREKEAAKIKAANERATARRLAKEYMELIEDERLELMELAASKKGLPSIISLDSDTLQNLNLFRDSLKNFPPKSVHLKFPFAVAPWVGSDENVGNLLMVWKFLMAFADVLTIWPFTIDEFVQSLHDYDSRLLGEIHIALLKSIIKDIEDVVRTPSVTSWANHNSTANLVGGHPQIVEGAFAWGFDIRSWQRHLNPLSWPEILRQFALSTGFGPRLKKRSIERAYYRDENEGHDGEDVISILRSGVAAENALAVMREKGFTRLRRSRHRLTPGTVKFAAFHVLSLEGSKGLTILEVADKIQVPPFGDLSFFKPSFIWQIFQKSGLRDLTTSKTPEASIAAALSRDTKLFERTAPSTYCVRAAYRKNPDDAETVIAAAREKIRIFQNGLSESEAEKECEDAEDVERDETSESDADDPDMDDMTIEKNLPKDLPIKTEPEAVKVAHLFGNGKELSCNEGGRRLRIGNGNTSKESSSFNHEDMKDSPIVGPRNNCALDAELGSYEPNVIDTQDAVIDESDPVEPWVLGLVEGEYSSLSVEERLNALVALIGVAIEGNSIREILEERLEAASSLKKQMWAEAQLDRRRVKEEYFKLDPSSFVSIRPDLVQVNAGNEGSRSPSVCIDNRNFHMNLNSAVNAESFQRENSNNAFTPTLDRNVLGPDGSAHPDNALSQQCNAVERSRSQVKLYIGHKAEEIYVYRSLPLGQDRRRNRYWQFVTCASKNDPGCSRIFFESRGGSWRLIDSEEAFDALLSALDTRGVRESHLHSMLLKIEPSFKEAVRRGKQQPGALNSNLLFKLDTETCAQEYKVDADSPSSIICDHVSDSCESSTSFIIEVGRNEFEKAAALKRYQDFQKWLWDEYYNSNVLCSMKYGKRRCPELLASCFTCCGSFFYEDKHCTFCHKTFMNSHNIDLSFKDHVFRCEERRNMDPKMAIYHSDSCLPMRVLILKMQLSHIEASIPFDALLPFWTEGYRKSWAVKLNSCTSAENLLQILTLLESAIKRDWLSTKFETTNELSSYMSNYSHDDSAAHSGSVPMLPWIPKTTAAVALRLMDFDSSVSYALHQKLDAQKDRETGELLKLPSRCGVFKSTEDFEPTDTPDDIEFQHEFGWPDPGIGSIQLRGRGSYGRGRGRGRGGRGQRGNRSFSRYEMKEEKLRLGERSLRRENSGRARGRGRRRGRRSVRPRQRFQNRVTIEKNVPMSSFLGISNIAKQSSPGELSRSSEGEEWPAAEITGRSYTDDVDYNSIGSSGSDDNDQQSGDEYDEQMEEDYVRDYNGKPGTLMDAESEEYDVDIGETDGNERDGDFENDDMEEDIDGDDEIENANSDNDDGVESYSSDYSE